MRERARHLAELVAIDAAVLVWLLVLLSGCSARRTCVQCCPSTSPTPAPTPMPTPTPGPTPAPTPPPTVAFCTFPQGVPDEAFVEHPAVPAQFEVDLVNAAISRVGHCNVNSDCSLGTTNPQAAMQRIIEELHKDGLCAGQHRNGETDEIAVTTYGCASPWNGYHAVHYPSQPGQQAKAVWAAVPWQPCMGNACTNYGGQSYRGAWVIPPGYCGGRAGRRR